MIWRNELLFYFVCVSNVNSIVSYEFCCLFYFSTNDLVWPLFLFCGALKAKNHLPSFLAKIISMDLKY